MAGLSKKEQIMLLISTKVSQVITAISSLTVSVQVDDKFDQPLRVDDAGGGITYLGYANPGTLDASALWAIARITEVVNDITIEWADGNKTEDNIWNNRAALSYS